MNKNKKRKVTKACFVLTCSNSCTKTPGKTFFTVPANSVRRKKWFKAAGYWDVQRGRGYYCCEDHFNLKQDMANFTRFNLMGGSKYLKEHVVPHIFKKPPASIYGCIDSNMQTEESPEVLAYKDTENLPAHQEHNTESSSSSARLPTTSATAASSSNNSTDDNYPQCTKRPKIDNEAVDQCACSDISKTYNADTENLSAMFEPTENENSSSCTQINAAVQVRPLYRCKAVQVQPTLRDNSSQTFEVKQTPEIKSQNDSDSDDSCHSSQAASIITMTSTTTTTVISPSTSGGWPSPGRPIFRLNNRPNTMQLIENDPKLYLGVHNPWYKHIIPILQDETKLTETSILVVLMKVRLNDAFVLLAHRFDFSRSYCCRLFNHAVNPIASCLASLIFFPEKIQIKLNLPIPFRANFYNVCAIIDAFEIEIEKPSNPVHQSMTFSNYKKCNTIKYLIASTPDGLITFISRGYGGRTSDTKLFEESGIMESIPPECSVMADRGFKHIDTILSKKKCKLLRPPSVLSTTKPTREEVIQTKIIASLRIHIERIIRRIREFKMLTPHACVDHFQLKYLDSAVLIAAGLINLQTPIINT